jgi:membrane-anchored protein YejM (alkaline phosphatase superfamily)
MTPECTPNIYAFSQEAENYTQHISSSNGTRGGIFGLFTGVTSYYWDSFEYANLQPLLVTELLRQGYQVQTYPSATLTGPPFAKMLFADVKGLNVTTEGKTVYDRDCQLTRNFLSDLEKRDSVKPFFSFLFYDLPHAIELSKDKLYHFQPSWEYADYTKLNNDLDPTPFFNLYRNCVWTVDSLAGQVIDALKQKDLLKNTVVMITGDHGQEFNENHKNYWGHWANYSRPQTGVPMIYYYPGCKAGDRNYRTTHYDVSTTLLKQVLGVQNPPEDLSMGRMLQDSTSRDWHVVGNDLFYAFILNDGTIIEKRGAGNVVVFDKHMNQLDDYPLNAKQLNDAIIRLNRFYK